MPKPAEVYRTIRKANPRKPFGPHWEVIGYYCGDGVWCDPRYVGLPGEYDHYYREVGS